jgi:hypothetical protein
MNTATDGGLSCLLQQIQETDQENLRLKTKLQRFASLEITLRNLAQADMVARDLLSMLEDGHGAA